jgi:hypothetical protein
MQSGAAVDVNPILRWVYAWMTLGMILTFGTGFFISTFGQGLVENPVVVIVALVAQIGLVLALSFGLRRMSPGLAAALFLIYSGTMGITIGLVFLLYSPQAIISALGSTVILFGSMTVFGFVTKMDLTKWGTYLFIGLIGIIGASIFNIFIGSDGLSFIISIAGVVIFTGLTAYDTQRIKLMAQDPMLQADSNLAFKLSIMGALTLYLDFINLFLFLLRLFSSRD